MWKAQKARFPHSHNHYCYCRFFSFLKHNFSFTPAEFGLRRLDSQQGRRSADAADAEGIRAFLSPRSPKRNRLEQAEWDRLEREKQEQAKRARLDQERQGHAEQERLEYERKDRAEQGGWKASGRRGLSTSGRLRQRKRFLNDLC